MRKPMQGVVTRGSLARLSGDVASLEATAPSTTYDGDYSREQFDEMILRDDFTVGHAIGFSESFWLFGNANNGSVGSSISPGRIGILSLSTGGIGSGGFVRYSKSPTFASTMSFYELESEIAIIEQPTGTQKMEAFFGFSTQTDGDIATGNWYGFIQRYDTNQDHWCVYVKKSGGSAFYLPVGPAITFSNLGYIRLKIKRDAGTIYFYVNNVLVHSFVITGDPYFANSSYAPLYHIKKTLGTSAIRMFVDWIYGRFRPTRPT